MDIVVECKDKASLLIQRNTHTHTVQPHTSGNYPTYTHNAVNGLSTTKPSCPWFWHENTERLTHYTRGRDLVMEQMRSPKVPVKDLRFCSCVCEGTGAGLNLHWTLRKTVITLAAICSIWISFESELLLSTSPTHLNSEIQFQMHTTESNQSHGNFYLA